MSYLYDEPECDAMVPGAKSVILERDDAEAKHWRRQCEKRVEFRKPFVWHGNSTEVARRAAGKESGI